MTKIKTKPAHWLECSKCLASVGFGKKVASRLLNTSVSSIKQKWNREGIVCDIPPCGSWKAYNQNKQRPQKILFKEYQRLWMKEIKQQKKHGFSWGDFWKHDAELVKEGKKMSKTWSGQRKTMTEEERKEKRRAYNSTEKAKLRRRENRKKRRARDPGYKIKRNLGNRLRDLMKTTKKGGYKGKSSLIGCSTKELAHHLESKFDKHMTWDNYGTYWHVDHILPCASFDHDNEEHIKICWHWSNLQPLEAKENMMKSDTITDTQMQLLTSYL